MLMFVLCYEAATERASYEKKHVIPTIISKHCEFIFTFWLMTVYCVLLPVCVCLSVVVKSNNSTMTSFNKTKKHVFDNIYIISSICLS